MYTRVRRLLLAPVFEGDDEKTRMARLLNVVSLCGLVSGVALVVLARVVVPRAAEIGAVLGLVLGLGSCGLLVLVRLGRVRWAGVGLAVLTYGIVTWGVLTFGGIRSAAVMGYLLVIVMGGLFAQWRGAITFGVLCGVAGAAAFWAERGQMIELPRAVVSVGDLVAVIAACVFTSLLVSAARRGIAAESQRSRQAAADLAERNRELQTIRASLERRTANLRATAEVAQQIATVLDPAQLVRLVVDLVRERFGLYYVGLFLVEAVDQDDPMSARAHQSFAVLSAGTGDAGRQMLAQGHRLVVGGDSMIGQCIAAAEARIELDVDRALLRYSNPLLPETRSELAVPLFSRGRVLGAITAQSTEVSAFDHEDIVTMQTLADQVASALDNVRLYADAQESADRSQRTVRRYVRENWDTLGEAERIASGYRYTTQQAGPAEDAWLSSMESAVREGDVVAMGDAPEGSVLAVPLVQNGVVIGVLGLRRPAGEAWSAEEQALVRSIGGQMTQALETQRLFQATRERARRESILRRATDRVRSQADLTGAIQAAAEEMRRVVGATHVAIRLGTDSRSTSPNGHGLTGRGDGGHDA